MKEASPVPFDIFVAQKTRVLVVTGPNTGGKTIFLKTVGLAAMMAKAGMSKKLPIFKVCTESAITKSPVYIDSDVSVF